MADIQKEPPLITVTNPVTYLRRFWEKIVGNEGMELKITIKPLTTIFGIALLGTIAFGLGEFVIPEDFKIPFVEFKGYQTSTPLPTQTSDWKQTAFTGKLQYSDSNQKYFLVTTASEAITLGVPTNLDLAKLIGKRILVIGEYSKAQRLIKVGDIKDMEVLPKSPEAIPTIMATSVDSSKAEISPSTTPIPTDIMTLESQ